MWGREHTVSLNEFLAQCQEAICVTKELSYWKVVKNRATS